MIKIILLIALIILILLINRKKVMAHNHSSYSHDRSVNYEVWQYDAKNWMESLPDSRMLSQLSIPGTHDTVSFYWGDIAQTQSMPLEIQLNSGIRFLDIRCYYKRKNYFEIYHGPSYQYTDLDTVLDTVVKFLKENPKETILMRIKQENSDVSNSVFKESFLDYVNRYQDLFWDNGGLTLTDETLGNVRGKIVVLYDVSTLNVGINYRSLKTLDEDRLSTNWSLYRKWEGIKAVIPKINADPNDGRLYLTYLSGSGGSFPYFVVSGHSNPATGAPRLATGLTEPGWPNTYPDFPRVDRWWIFSTIAFEGTNTLTKALIDNRRYQRVGIIATDFPGAGLISSIVRVNTDTIYDFIIMAENNIDQFATLKFDLYINNINILIKGGKPNSIYNDSYLKIQIYDGNKNVVYDKEFIGNQEYAQEDRNLHLGLGYSMKIQCKDPNKIMYGGVFDSNRNILQDTEAEFARTLFGIKRVNAGDNTIRFKGYQDKEFANLKLDVASNRVYLQTNQMEPNKQFDSVYLTIQIFDKNNTNLYTREYKGNVGYGSQKERMSVSIGDKIKLISQEPIKVTFDKPVDDRIDNLKYVENTFEITNDGLTESNQDYSIFKFLGLGDIEYANMKVDLVSQKLFLNTAPEEPHVYFNDVYLSIIIFDENESIIYTRNYYGNQLYGYQWKVIEIKDQYKIRITAKEPGRVRFYRAIGLNEMMLEKTTTIYMVEGDRLVEL